MAANALEVTFYKHTGYSPNDEPASDSVIESNAKVVMPLLIRDYNPDQITTLEVKIDEATLDLCDYLKIRDTVTNERYYYYILSHNFHNEKTATIQILIDDFATVGLSNIRFYGNISRRSLSASEKQNYPLIAEPWAPSRPLKVRHMLIDTNVNKAIKLPSHVSTTFEPETTAIDNEVKFPYPETALQMAATPDKLEVHTEIPFGYANIASDTNHTINTPWGDIQYTTPFEQYLTLSASALVTFLAQAKKHNALDMLGSPYYIPNPGNISINVDEVSEDVDNPKAAQYYTTITIRSLAGNTNKTYGIDDIDLQYSQALTAIIVPDKDGGIYLIPANLRDTGLSAYNYLDGVYSPFEGIVFNAKGDTPGKFASDGTIALNTELNNLFQTYANKINQLQFNTMKANYFKDVGTVKGAVLAFTSELLGVAHNITTTEAAKTETQYTTQWYDRGRRDVQTSEYQDNSYQTTDVTTETSQIPYQSGANLNYLNYIYSDSGAAGGGASGNYIRTTSAENVKRTTTIDGTHGPVGSAQNPKRNMINETHMSTEVDSWRNQVTTPARTTTTTETVTGSIGVAQGDQISRAGVDVVYEDSPWLLLKNILGKSYADEVHTFMLGNINDYLNRWTALQNDIHNGKTANLFKNVTLVGQYGDVNKLAGKYEIIIASLRAEDMINFDMFLNHFGHAVDEYRTALVTDAGGNYNYTMAGQDSILTNNVHQDSSAKILNQFRAGVRVWKTLIRPENF